MKLLLNFILLLMFPLVSSAQEVVATYHSSFYNEDFNVEIDCKEAKFKGKDVTKRDYDKQLYFEVKSNDPNIKAYIQLSPGKAKNLADKISKRYGSLQNWAKKSKQTQKDDGDGEVTLFFSTYNKELGQEITARETGQDYEIYFIKTGDNARIYYDGESASNEGDFNLKLSGWSLVIVSEEDIKQIDSALKKALEVYK